MPWYLEIYHGTLKYIPYQAYDASRSAAIANGWVALQELQEEKRFDPRVPAAAVGAARGASIIMGQRSTV